MLRQETALDEPTRYTAAPAAAVPPPTVAGTTRVATDELIAAIAEIEARRDASQRWQADTIALGDAVRQLGLNMSPEELLAAVEDLRARRYMEAQEAAYTQSRRRGKKTTLAVLTLVMLVPFLLFGFLFTARYEAVPEAPAQAITTSVPVLQGAYTLDTLPDRTPAYAELSTIYEYNHGKSAANIELQSTPTTQTEALDGPKQLWKVIKLNGKAYLQGWRWSTATSDHTIYAAHSSTAASQAPVTIPLSLLGDRRDASGILDHGFGTSHYYVEYINLTDAQMRSLQIDR